MHNPLQRQQVYRLVMKSSVRLDEIIVTERMGLPRRKINRRLEKFTEMLNFTSHSLMISLIPPMMRARFSVASVVPRKDQEKL